MTKKRKAIWITGVLVMVVIIAGFGLAVNSGACGFGPFYRHGFYGRCLPPFMLGEIKSFVAWRMDSEAKGLGLSGDQQQKYETFRARFLETMEKVIETRAQFHKRAFSFLESDTPDLSAMAIEAKKNVEMISGAISEDLSQFAEFFSSLESTQRKIITDKIKSRINEHKSNFSYNERQM